MCFFTAVCQVQTDHCNSLKLRDNKQKIRQVITYQNVGYHALGMLRQRTKLIIFTFSTSTTQSAIQLYTVTKWNQVMSIIRRSCRRYKFYNIQIIHVIYTSYAHVALLSRIFGLRGGTSQRLSRSLNISFCQFADMSLKVTTHSWLMFDEVVLA